MRNISDYQYHVERARAELDCGYRAQGHAAAIAHMRLSSLHMDRARLAKAATRDVSRSEATAREAPSAA